MFFKLFQINHHSLPFMWKRNAVQGFISSWPLKISQIYSCCELIFIMYHFAPGQSEELGQAKTSNGYTWRCSNFLILFDQRPSFPAGYRFLRHGSALTSPTHLPETLWLKSMPRSVSVTLSTSPSSHPSQKISSQNYKVSLCWHSVGRQYLKRDTESCQTVFSGNLGNL